MSKYIILNNTITTLESIEKELPAVGPIINELAKIKRDLAKDANPLELPLEFSPDEYLCP